MVRFVVFEAHKLPIFVPQKGIYMGRVIFISGVKTHGTMTVIR